MAMIVFLGKTRLVDYPDGTRDLSLYEFSMMSGGGTS